MITLIVELSCDHPDCDLAYAPTPEEMTSLKETRVGSRNDGWTRRGDRDYCPTHGSDDTAALAAVVRGLAAKHQRDDQIAEGLGLARWQVQRIRAKYGIPPGVRPGRPAGSMTRRRA